MVYDKIEIKKKALAHNIRVMDKGKLINFGEMIFANASIEQYATRAMPCDLIELGIMLSNENTRAEGVAKLRHRYFMAGVLYAIENPEVKELSRPASEHAKMAVEDEIKNMEYEKESRIQKKPSYG